ncbi:MAG: anhydro-N-acetylmuramic acid kinase [Succinivibrionaceae bacterium]|nr:anhydro-N-acetylmuramic acid kinase [Succinivibrionaceae bacterium]
MATEIYVGLMSGTSIDGLDACLLGIEGGRPRPLHTLSRAFPADLRLELHRLCSPGDNEIERAGAARARLAAEAAALTLDLLGAAGVPPQEVVAIGSHGQTIRHHPSAGYSWQLDDGARIAYLTGIDTITDFRSADVAAQGQGAPLTPIFHQVALASPERVRLVLNLGGIANLTALRPGGAIECGFDTGPANTLLDLACRELFGIPYDKDATLARQGQPRLDWLQRYLAHPYFSRRPPKSTGREDFSPAFIRTELEACRAEPRLGPDLLATLCELTALTVVNEVRALRHRMGFLEADLILCGGGAFNPLLAERLSALLRRDGIALRRSGEFGVDEQYLESEAFAYFAHELVHCHPLGLSAVTGARRDLIGGALYPAPGGHFSRSQAIPRR